MRVLAQTAVGALVATGLMFAFLSVGHAEPGYLPGPPATAGTHIVVFTGGTIEEAILAAPGVDSIWATANSQLVGYLVGAPSFVNADFMAAFTGGAIPANTPLILLLSSAPPAQPASTPIATPTPTATPLPTPTPTAPTPVVTSVTPFTAWIINAEIGGWTANEGGYVVPAWPTCTDTGDHLGWGLYNGTAVEIHGQGVGECAGWWLAHSANQGQEHWVPPGYLSSTPPAVYEPPPPPPSGGSTGSDVESVYVYSVLDYSEVIIQRQNGELWLLEYGVGCLSLSFYEGRSVLIYSPTLFAGISAKILIPERDQSCTIWDRERL